MYFNIQIKLIIKLLTCCRFLLHFLIPSYIVFTPWFFRVVKNGGQIIFIFHVVTVLSSHKMLGANTVVFTQNIVNPVNCANQRLPFLVVLRKSKIADSQPLAHNVATLSVNKQWNADVSVPPGSVFAHVRKSIPQLT